jgi:hypothetical protein
MPLVFETLHVREEGAVLFVEVAAQGPRSRRADRIVDPG